jgi:hypothetical protein
MWSPKVNSNNKINPCYENMREVARGDLIFSFNDTKVMALGVAGGPAARATISALDRAWLTGYKRRHRWVVGVCVTVAFGKKTGVKWEFVL